MQISGIYPSANLLNLITLTDSSEYTGAEAFVHALQFLSSDNCFFASVAENFNGGDGQHHLNTHVLPPAIPILRLRQFPPLWSGQDGNGGRAR